MAYLPPVGWADVVTKQDLDYRLEAMEGRLLSELAATTRTVVFSVIGTNLGVAGLALALARIAS